MPKNEEITIKNKNILKMRNSTQTIFWNAVLFCIMLTACTSNELAPVKGEKSLEFTITNYVQQDFDEATRSVPISESTVVTHLDLVSSTSLQAR